MKKETRNYVKNVMNSENFYVDAATTALSLVIIGMVIFVFLNPEMLYLFSYIFTLASITALINVYKGFKGKSATRYMYLIIASVAIVATVYCFIRL